MPEYPLGRLQHHDPLNRGFAALAGPTPPAQKTPGRAFWTPDVYDQQGSSCTAQSAVGICRTGPNYMKFKPFWSEYDSESERHSLYREAQRFDPWDGEEPAYEGTSTDAPMRVLRNRGVIQEWRWLFGIDEAVEWVTMYGPAVFGTNWSSDMFEPDARGYIWPRGSNRGGHAYRVVQYHLKKRAFRVVNSWGRDWGQGGRAWLHVDAAKELLADGGEVATVVT